MHIGLLGGSFNPIHNGHIAIARNILERKLVDKIWFIVSPQNPLKKDYDLLNEEIRLKLVQLAVEQEPLMNAIDIEFSLPRPSFSWNTLQFLSSHFPKNSFSLLIGADNWNVFHLWNHADSIVNNYNLLIYPRKGYEINIENLPRSVHYINCPIFPISSTEIRQKIKKGEDVSQWLSPKVYSFIKRMNLYK